MDSQGAANPQLNFDAMDFDAFSMPQAAFNMPKTAEMGNNFFGDEGIDTSDSFVTVDQQFDTMFPLTAGINDTDFGMQLPALDNTSASATWANTPFTPTPVQSFDTMYTPQLSSTALGKRSLQLDIQDFPQSKRHEGLGGLELGFTPYPTSSSVTGSSWTVPTPASSTELLVGLSDEAADVCATWFSKYNVLPSDRHIESLSQLTGESAEAIRKWFGQALKQGLGQDSAYKSQTSFTQDPLFHSNSAEFSAELIEQPVAPQSTPFQDAQVATTIASVVQAPVRGGKKGCNPTSDPELLKRDANKIYQCTRKCGKRYGRKCDWKRNEEEGYPSKSWMCSLCIEQNTERVKPCFRKYHFSQHFRNVHPGLDASDYEEASLVQNDTAFPRKCGFCTHRFISRQDRIDHIAEHFKEGKCMLEWNDEDNNDSDNTDDDDDSNDNNDNGRSDSSDFSDSQSYFPPGDDQYNGGSSSSKDNGGSDEQQQYFQGGFYQFQLSQSDGVQKDAGQLHGPKPHVPCEQSSGDYLIDVADVADVADVDSGESSCYTDAVEQHVSCGTPTGNTDKQLSWHGESYDSREKFSEHCKLPTTGVDSVALARDVITQPLTLPVPRIESSLCMSIQRPINDNRKLDISVFMPALRRRRGGGGKHLGEGVGRDVKGHGECGFGCGGVGVEGRGTLNVRTLNALLALLNPTQNQPPLLPPPLPSLVDVGDVSLSTKSSSPSVYGHWSLSAMLQDRTLDSNPTLQQYWKGLTPLFGQQNFLSVKLLGAGGFSTVDEVVHRETGLRISRKTLKNRQQSAVEELKKEVDTLQKLRHPHIIRIVGAISNGNKMSILLTPVAETTLAVWLEQKSLSKPSGLSSTIVKMLGCLSSTVRYLHEQRPVVKHMDIKPQNILVMQGNHEFPHVVLSDFGISSSDDDTALNSKPGPVTRQYCAPEVSGGICREKSADIWSLGCVFAEMATVAFSDDHDQWRNFRHQFLSGKSSHYSQDIPALQDWLTQFVDTKTAGWTEATVVSTVQSMLSAEPTERPDAAMLTMIFTPAPCCLSWPNEQASFPGPLEEMETVKSLTKKDGGDWQDLHGSAANNNALAQANSTDKSIPPAKKWLSECSSGHEACHHHKPGAGVKALPTRLVDIRPDGVEGEGCIVRIINAADRQTDVQEPVAYAALSYTWGDSEFKLTTQHAKNADLPRDVLSKRINEAISTASRIGYRYIWVDSLCIQQDSLLDVQRECVAMRDVYRNSDLTLVLPDVDGKLPTPPAADNSSTVFNGALQAPLRTVDYNAPAFAWDTRAWTLQERLLSRRLLHLGEQLYWECNELKASETFPMGMPPLLWEKVHTKTSATTSATKASSNCDDNVKYKIQNYEGSDLGIVLKKETVDKELMEVGDRDCGVDDCGTAKKMDAGDFETFFG